jgi:hypothetical protein
MASTLSIHSFVQEAGHSLDGRKPIYTSHHSSHNPPHSEQPPASLLKEWMDPAMNLSDTRFVRLLANNAQRLHTEVKGLWNSAPRSAHPTGAYGRGVDYPRLFQLDPSYVLNVKEPSSQQGPKHPHESQFATTIPNKVPVKAHSAPQSNASGFNAIGSAHQVSSRTLPSRIGDDEYSHDNPRLFFREFRKIPQTPRAEIHRYRSLRFAPMTTEYLRLIRTWSRES